MHLRQRLQRPRRAGLGIAQLGTQDGHLLAGAGAASCRRALSGLLRRHLPGHIRIRRTPAIDAGHDVGRAARRERHDQLDRPYVCFSFDDGLRQNLRAAQILHEFGVSACFFICPGFVGETSPDKLKEICATRFKMPPTEMLSWDDVDAMLALGQEIGSHTQTHQVLSRISAAALEDELGQSFDEFNQRLGGVKHFAWPEGRFWHFSATAAKAVFAAGYESCASAERGCHISAPDWPRPNLCLRRDYVSAHWPLSHTFYFLCRGSQNASVANNHWPAEWTDVIC